MAKDVSGNVDGPGWLPFDLLGQPVPKNKGQRGRPQHAPCPENLEKAVLLYAAGRTDADVAAAIGITVPTLKQHYFSNPDLQRVRRNAQMVVEGELLSRLNSQSKEGNVSATEKLMKRIDKSRLGPLPPRSAKVVKRRGLKDEQEEKAWAAGREDDDWGPDLWPDGKGLAH